MAKKPAKVAATAAIEKASESSAKAIGVRGLKGVPIEAKITVLVAKNPKRAGCAAEARFALYADGMTQEEFLAAGGTTPDMAYDTAHGFIAVEGYTPPKVFVAKEKKLKAEKPAKAAKVKKAKPEAQVAEENAAQADLEAATAEESID